MIDKRVYRSLGGNALTAATCRAGIMKKLLIIIVFLFSFAAMAEEPPVLDPLPEEASLPPPTGMSDEDLMEPEVTITKRDDAVVHEYRINGQLYMVKIIPASGYPYYLMDADGDGLLESRYNQIDPALMVPRWMIFRW
jgi:hypothetical protein